MRKAAFTLLEVAVALGLLAFCGLSLLGLLPLALRQTAENLGETRSAHLAGMIFSTLRDQPFRAADCFGSVVDLSTPTAQPLVFHGVFGPEGEPVIAAGPEPAEAGGYRIELRLEPEPTLPGSAARVFLTIRAAGGAWCYQSAIGDL